MHMAPCACPLFRGRNRPPSSISMAKVSDHLSGRNLFFFKQSKSFSRHPFSLPQKDEELPLLMSVLMGLQHAMAMVGGLITPPLVVFKFTVCGFSAGFCPDLVQVRQDKTLLCCISCLTPQLSNQPLQLFRCFYSMPSVLV